MRRVVQTKLAYLALCASLFSLAVVAQESVVENKKPEKIVATKTDTASTKNTASINTALTPDAKKPPEPKKMVQDATISLQTTITGNQEQPKVLYILPWQSPEPADVDFESLDNQQKAVFNHVERDELRRELEVSSESP